jgi:hypothetical protein
MHGTSDLPREGGAEMGKEWKINAAERRAGTDGLKRLLAKNF